MSSNITTRNTKRINLCRVSEIATFEWTVQSIHIMALERHCICQSRLFLTNLVRPLPYVLICSRFCLCLTNFNTIATQRLREPLCDGEICLALDVNLGPLSMCVCI